MLRSGRLSEAARRRRRAPRTIVCRRQVRGMRPRVSTGVSHRLPQRRSLIRSSKRKAQDLDRIPGAQRHKAQVRGVHDLVSTDPVDGSQRPRQRLGLRLGPRRLGRTVMRSSNRPSPAGRVRTHGPAPAQSCTGMGSARESPSVTTPSATRTRRRRCRSPIRPRAR